MDEVGYHHRLHARRMRSANARVGILDRKALRRLHAEARGGGEVGFGVRFGVLDVVTGDDDLEQLEKPGAPEMTKRVRSARGGGDGRRDTAVLELAQDFDHAVLNG